MKKLFVLIILAVIVCGLGYVGMGPQRTIGAIEAAVLADDIEGMKAHIDFPVLRENIKVQFNEKVTKDSSEEKDGNPFGALVEGFATGMIDKLVDVFVTPESIAKVISGDAKQSDSEEGPSTESVLFKDARYTYDSLSECSVWVPDEKGKERQFVLERRGIDWVMVNVMVDEKDISLK